MIRTIKVMLRPNNVQRTKLFECAGCARFAYNWALNYQQLNYEIGNDFLRDGELRRIFTQIKTQDGYRWLGDYSNNIAKQAIKDACDAYVRFFKGLAKYPRFKSKRRSKPSFYVDTYKIRFTDTHIKLEKLTTDKRKNRQCLNWVRLCEHGRIPVGAKYVNPRVTFDGLNWWISVGIECDEPQAVSANGEGIGIDIGVKTLAVCSDGTIYKGINKEAKVKRLGKKARRLQRAVSRKYTENKKGECYRKTRSIIKSEKQLLKVTRRLRNIRHDYIHKTTSEIVSRKPRFIVMEDLNVSGMMKNRHLSKALQEQCFNELYRQLAYKSHWHGIKFITADRFYPSSKQCCECGHIKRDLKLSERTYHCPECGNVIDRDYQASVNLKMYGESIA